MELFGKVLFEMVITVDVDDFFCKSGEFNADFSLGATKNSLAEQSSEGVPTTRVECLD